MRYRPVLSMIATAAALLTARLSFSEPAATPAYVFAEAEEFKVESGDWEAKPWGTNYYAATFANSFLSRQSYLGAPEQGVHAEAAAEVEIPSDGEYLVCVRYEAAFGFETRFGLRIEQGGKEVFSRLYGAMDNPKLWAFRERVKPQVRWYWGPVENIVWEGVASGEKPEKEEPKPEELAALAKLTKGKARLVLTKDPQPGPAARRNVDVIMLTTDMAEIEMRIQKENYLPLDGLLTQAGDLFLKVKNPADAPGPVVLYSPVVREHAPYWVHIRKWKPVWIGKNGAHPKLSDSMEWLKPGEESPWVEIGSAMDALNVSGYFPEVVFPKDAQKKSLDLEFSFGVPGAGGPPQVIKTIRYRAPNRLTASFAVPGDVRYCKTVLTDEEILEKLLGEIKKFPFRGRVPKDILFYNTFMPGNDNSPASQLMLDICLALGNNVLNDMPGRVDPALIKSRHLTFRQTSNIDVRSIATEELKSWIKELKAKKQWPYVKVVSMGDEIRLGAPKPGKETDARFQEWLKSQGLRALHFLPDESRYEEMPVNQRWELIKYQIDKETRDSDPTLYYHSVRFRYQHGIDALKKRVQILEEGLPKGALIGANYSPHPHYWPHYFQWIELFRQRAMTMPWSEDYIWQIPVTTQQIMGYIVSAFRCAAQKHNLPIYMYVMPHTPGNTPASFRRAFYVDVAHGAKYFDFFSPVPTSISYTENNMLPESIDMYRAMYDVIHEAGMFEDLVFPGKVRPAEVAILMTGTSDIWNRSTLFNAERQHLYLALRHSQIAVDIVAEDDIVEGGLKNYKALYMADTHLRSDASRALHEWVEAGGLVFATAGAGMWDENNQPNRVMEKVLGVAQTKLETSTNYLFGKDNLPRMAPMDTIRYKLSRHALPGTINVYAAKATLNRTRKPGVGRFVGRGRKVEVLGRFRRGWPALFSNELGQGKAITCAAFPGTAYVKAAMPDRPCDRGATDDAFAHFLPTRFDIEMRAFLARWAFEAGVTRPIITTEALVETSWIESPAGIAIPLINYKGEPLDLLEVRVLNAGTMRHVSSVVQGELPTETRKGQLIIKLPLDVADMLLLRRYPPPE